MTILEWLRLPKDQWKPARAVFPGDDKSVDTENKLAIALEIERQLKSLEAERDSNIAELNLLRNLEYGVREDFPLEGELSKRCDEILRELTAMKTPSGRSV